MPLGDAGTEILHEHIGLATSRFSASSAAAVLQIQHDRALVAVVVEKRRGEPVAAVGAGAGVVRRPGASTLITSAP